MERFLHEQRPSRQCGHKGWKNMEPKLYLLFALFSIILASTSHESLRKFLRKLRLLGSRQSRLQRQA